MVRPRSRKTIEDMYAVAPPPPPSLVTSRFDENFFQNSKNHKCSKFLPGKSDVCNTNTAACKNRKGPSVGDVAENKNEKTTTDEEKFFGKKVKSKKIELLKSPNMDNMNVMSINATDIDKDEETDEFFGLIKDTVEHAVAKTVSDIFSRNFKEISSKIDELRDQLQLNEAKLDKIHADVNNKIVHYGEENSRHFRYLCMKSEYDKMFYQHQNVMTPMPIDARQNFWNQCGQQFVATGTQQVPANTQLPANTQVPINTQVPGNTKSTTSLIAPPHKAANHPHQGCGDIQPSKSSMSAKSSQIAIKKVEDLLEQLQKFYEQQQSEDTNRKVDRKNKLPDVGLSIEDDSGDGDDDEDSFDDLISPSVKRDFLGGGDA